MYRLSSCTQDPEHVRSGVAACGILSIVPWPGIKPMSHALQGRFLTTRQTKKFLVLQFLKTSWIKLQEIKMLELTSALRLSGVRYLVYRHEKKRANEGKWTASSHMASKQQNLTECAGLNSPMLVFSSITNISPTWPKWNLIFSISSNKGPVPRLINYIAQWYHQNSDFPPIFGCYHLIYQHFHETHSFTVTISRSRIHSGKSRNCQA